MARRALEPLGFGQWFQSLELELRPWQTSLAEIELRKTAQRFDDPPLSPLIHHQERASSHAFDPLYDLVDTLDEYIDEALC